MMKRKITILFFSGIISITLPMCNNRQVALRSSDNISHKDIILHKILHDLSGNWYATKYFIYAKIGTLGDDEANQIINKCLFKIHTNEIISYLEDTGYNSKGEAINYDTIIDKSVSLKILYPEDKNYSFDSLRKNFEEDKFTELSFGKKADMIDDSEFRESYSIFMIGISGNVWVDNGSCVFRIERR
jgi:hypothetical protein